MMGVFPVLRYNKTVRIKPIIYILFVLFCCLYAYSNYLSKNFNIKFKSTKTEIINLEQNDLITISQNKFKSLLSEKNKTKLVLIYAAWCRFCRDEIAILSNILPNYHDKNLSVVLISLDNDKKTLLNLLNKYNIGNLTKPYLADSTLKEVIYFLLGNYKIKYSGTIPVLAVIDTDGNVYQGQRYKNPDTLNKLLQLTLNQT
ncbi:hypothetical protein CAXC1_60012 [Candidatus Xenohaliotis californiensis]|uniref:Thioredoxin domain-containing protein n=1 Tax=Candidatus Xenohaliotis californiensis TaxID=84677 RepID=A0ABM9N923_9RICK|nr:hypothetical protein CAXC1_60012 [Candidatus Xenohaliotis californiensis]